MSLIRRLVIPASAVLALVAAGPASAQSPAFAAPQALPGSLPGTGQFQGGEPSVSFDPAGDGHVYAVAPGANGTNGVGFWRSSDHGQTWSPPKAIGSQGGGGDSDVEVGLDHTVYVADLEVAANAICRSLDFGATFDSGCETRTASNQQGPESDREWINHDPHDPNVLYFTYHDITAQFPLIYRSENGGSSFTPCGNVYEPGSDAFLNFGPGGTDVGKPAIGSDGSIYVPITEPSNPGTPSSSYNHFDIAAAPGGCKNGTQFKNSVIYTAPGADLANIFSSVVVGVDGTVYALSAGKLTAAQKTYNVYLWTSHDKGSTWSKPLQVNTPDLTANALPAIAPGLGAGQVAIGWYGSGLAGTPPDDKNQWRYYVAESTDGGASFVQTTVTQAPYHFGGICTGGIQCVTGGNRNLLDFSSIGVDPSDGTVLPVLPGDPFDTPQNGASDSAAVYVARQTAGRLVPGATLSGAHAAGTGAALPKPGVAARGTRSSRACAATAGFAAVGARPAGSRVRLTFTRRAGEGADVDVFQSSHGRTIVGERLVARFRRREFGFTWDGKANRQGRSVGDGYYFVRFRTELPNKREDIRRMTLRRVHGRWQLRPSFYRRASCGTLSAFKLERPVFGGPANRALGISYRLSAAARVRVTVLQGRRVVGRFATRTRRASRTYRLRFAAEHRPRGDYRVVLTAVRPSGAKVASALTARRL
jgi:hypothetical protein